MKNFFKKKSDKYKSTYKSAVDALRNKSFGKACAISDNIIRSRGISDSSRASIYYIKADALMEMDRFEDAIKAYTSGLKYRMEIDGLLGRGHAFFYTKKYKNAKNDYDKILSLSPKDDVALRGAGEAAIRLGDYGEAKIYLNKALEIRPDYAAAAKTLRKLDSLMRRQAEDRIEM